MYSIILRYDEIRLRLVRNSIGFLIQDMNEGYYVFFFSVFFFILMRTSVFIVFPEVSTPISRFH